MSRPVLDLDLLRAFVAVADHRSFTRAAGTLDRTQSAVSMQIRRLEHRLGVELFHRSTVSVVLSSAGTGFLADARRLLALNDDVLGRLLVHKVEGHVRLGVMDDYGTIVLPPLLATFVAGHPCIRIDVETGLTAAMTGRLGQAFDLVIAMHPEGRGDGEVLRRERAVWAAGASYVVGDREPLPVALYPQGCLLRRWASEALDAAKRPWRLAFVSHSLAAVESVVAQGLAVTVVKSGTCPVRLRPLSERDGMPGLPAADIALHRAPNLSRAGALLADHLVAHLRQPG